MIPGRVRILGLGEQLAHLRLRWPGFQSQVSDGVLTATGSLQPTEISAIYTVNVRQHGGKNPEVRVLSPQLEMGPNGEAIPHMYEQDRLCLFVPGGDEWKPDDPIATTILPWASLWLYFYEVWKATGDWLGGGIHPETPITIRRTSRDHRFFHN